MIDMIIIATIFSLLTTQTTEENPADDSIIIFIVIIYCYVVRGGRVVCSIIYVYVLPIIVMDSYI